MTRQTALDLDDPTRPVPTRPSLIHFEGGQAQIEAFDDLDALGRRIVQLAGDVAGLRHSERAWPCAFPGLEVFFAWSIYRQAADGAQTWLGSAAIQQQPPAALAEAIARARAAGEGRRAAA